MRNIEIRGLIQNNLKNINLDIPKQKIILFTGVSGSGKSSIVFDTIATESQRQMNETYPAYIKGKLPQYSKPDVQSIKNLSPSIIVDQSSFGQNIRSTVGTITDLYTDLRVLFSRIGKPKVGTASYFSFNDPKGMCPECSGLGIVTTINIDELIDFNKSLNEGCIRDSSFAPNSWYWKQYAESNLFDLDKPISKYNKQELNLLLYGSKEKDGMLEDSKVTGIVNKSKQSFLNRDVSNMSKTTKKKVKRFTTQTPCASCCGKRLNQDTLKCKIQGYSIADMCELELTELLKVIQSIKDDSVSSLLNALKSSIARMIEVGLSYLQLNRATSTLSGGEAQRLKLVRYMGSSLSDMLYIFDEPSTGMHSYDIEKINKLITRLKREGNTVIVVEHDKEIIQIADEVIDIGMYAGKSGGEIVFQGSYHELLNAETVTSKSLKDKIPIKEKTRIPKTFYSIKHATMNNLKDVSVGIPVEVLSVITGVAGSGKSTLISKVFAEKYKKEIVIVNQKPIVATNRSTPATFLGVFDYIRDVFAEENNVDKGYFSFNSKGACEHCKGKGVVVTELVHMSPVVTTCEYCNGNRYNDYALSLKYKNQSIIDVLSMNIDEAINFFIDTKISNKLKQIEKVGLSYMTLGQPLSTLSGGEIQRIKLAQALNKKGKIFILDEPTTGLHSSDVTKLMRLFNSLVDKKNTVIIIEHNLDVMKQADYIIDIGPKAGKNGGEIVFTGTPKEMTDNGNSLTANSLRNSIKY
ncbi:ATP-binding cassette domain-containing protein [Tetragenococcus solitarius]|uniref:UvrABC system protein A n=1 Tax=Tetragenococcus solitarius TaxID=71453 RepID=A0ABP6KPA4_9ENTE|nr:excinuclease ABC subunit UvrA [Tetragenococcus solitarius]